MSQARRRAAPGPATIDVRASLPHLSALRVVVVPVGRLSDALFDAYLDLLTHSRRVALQEVSPWTGAEGLPDPFTGRSWMRSHVLLDFVTREETRPQHLHAAHRPAVVLGLLSGRAPAATSDLAAAARAFTQACAKDFPAVEVTRLWVVDATAAAAAPRLPDVNVDVIPDVITGPKLRSYVQTLVHDIVSQAMFCLQQAAFNPQRARHLEPGIAEPNKTRRLEERRKARLQKHWADLCLIAADYSGARRLYQEAAAVFRAQGAGEAPLEAACLEGESSAMYLLAAPPDGVAALREEVAPRCAKAAELYRRANERAFEIEALLRLGKYWGQIQARVEAMDVIREAWSSGTVLPPLDRVALAREVAEVCERMGCTRRAAFYTREAAALEQRRGSPTALHLFLQAARLYHVPVQLDADAPSAPGAALPPPRPGRGRGMPLLQGSVLLDLLQVVGQHHPAWRPQLLVLWLLSYHAHLEGSQYLGAQWRTAFTQSTAAMDLLADELAAQLQARQRDKGEVVQDWGADAAGDDLPRAEAQYAALWAERRRITHRLHTDTQRQVLADLTKAAGEEGEEMPPLLPVGWLMALEPRPLPPPLRPVQGATRSAIDGVFIHNPFAKKHKGSDRAQWVVGAVCTAVCTLRNPLLVDIPICALALVAEGAPLKCFSESCVLKAAGEQTVTLSCQPLRPGYCTLVGVSAVLEVAPLAAPMHWAVPAADGSRGAAAVADGPLLVKVVPSLPVVEVTVAAAVELLPGQEGELQVRLRNTSDDHDVATLALSFEGGESGPSGLVVTAPDAASILPLRAGAEAVLVAALRAPGALPVAEAAAELPGQPPRRVELTVRYGLTAVDYSSPAGDLWRKEAGPSPTAPRLANGSVDHNPAAAPATSAKDAATLDEAFPPLLPCRLSTHTIAVTVSPGVVVTQAQLSPCTRGLLLALTNTYRLELGVWVVARGVAQERVTIPPRSSRVVRVAVDDFAAEFHAARNLHHFLHLATQSMALHWAAAKGDAPVHGAVPLQLLPPPPAPPPAKAAAVSPDEEPPPAVRLEVVPHDAAAAWSGHPTHPLACHTGEDYTLRFTADPRFHRIRLAFFLCSAAGERNYHLSEYLLLVGRTCSALPATGHCVDIRLWVPGLYKIDVLLTDPSAATQTPLHVELSLLAIDRTT